MSLEPTPSTLAGAFAGLHPLFTPSVSVLLIISSPLLSSLFSSLLLPCAARCQQIDLVDVPLPLVGVSMAMERERQQTDTEGLVQQDASRSRGWVRPPAAGRGRGSAARSPLPSRCPATPEANGRATIDRQEMAPQANRVELTLVPGHGQYCEF